LFDYDVPPPPPDEIIYLDRPVLAGHDHLKRLSVTLILGSDPDFHRGHANRRASAPGTRCHRAVREGVDRGQAEGCPWPQARCDRQMRWSAVAHGGAPRYGKVGKKLRRKHPKGGQRSLREISAALTAAGYVNERGAPFAATSVRNTLGQRTWTALGFVQVDISRAKSRAATVLSWAISISLTLKLRIPSTTAEKLSCAAA
jgi:hypothetical protein